MCKGVKNANKLKTHISGGVMALDRFYEKHPNCNRCKPGIKCAGISNLVGCRSYIPPKDTWMLVELALVYPTSLNNALSQLPFEVNLGFYLK